ncbi:hypothetical protein [Serratia fonticola]|uniref:hypothetical protein n=1 Tax=Serratia fonticola TaxID=47917 RepID=UPI00217B0500|nr:hypothetical protein [Serratia fonticola]CAI1037884.1 Uncharacterised protein [Serratia fonticola]HBE9080227.1 hypothetical protein [Serratia fonticola]
MGEVIQAQMAKVYYAPTKKRRYFSKSAAIRAETNAIIFARYPYEHPEYEGTYCTYPGYNFAVDEEDRYRKMYRRLHRLVAKSVGGM